VAVWLILKLYLRLIPPGIKPKQPAGRCRVYRHLYTSQLHQSRISTAGARRYFVIQNPGSGSQNGTAPKVADAILTTTDCEAEAAVGAGVRQLARLSRSSPKSHSTARQCSTRISDFRASGVFTPHYHIHSVYDSASKTTLCGYYRLTHTERGV